MGGLFFWYSIFTPNNTKSRTLSIILAHISAFSASFGAYFLGSLGAPPPLAFICGMCRPFWKQTSHIKIIQGTGSPHFSSILRSFPNEFSHFYPIFYRGFSILIRIIPFSTKILSILTIPQFFVRILCVEKDLLPAIVTVESQKIVTTQLCKKKISFQVRYYWKKIVPILRSFWSTIYILVFFSHFFSHIPVFAYTGICPGIEALLAREEIVEDRDEVRDPCLCLYRWYSWDGFFCEGCG